MDRPSYAVFCEDLREYYLVPYILKKAFDTPKNHVHLFFSFSLQSLTRLAML